jgi:hypothetical protein
VSFARGFLVGLITVCAFVPSTYAQEAGSSETEDPVPSQPMQIIPAQSGSQEKPGGVILPGSTSLDSENGKTHAAAGPTERTPSTQSDSTSTDRGQTTESIPRLLPWLLPILVFLVGLFLVGWLLFRMGLFNPYTATLWPKRLELCIEIALRMDDFMTAYGEENFNKCQMSLEALNHLNGRRSILLSNEINAAVNKFVEQAVNAKISKGNEAFQINLNRQYEIVIEALRIGTRQEELSLEVLRSLTKAQGPHRRLKDSSS